MVIGRNIAIYTKDLYGGKRRKWDIYDNGRDTRVGEIRGKLRNRVTQKYKEITKERN